MTGSPIEKSPLSMDLNASMDALLADAVTSDYGRAPLEAPTDYRRHPAVLGLTIFCAITLAFILSLGITQNRRNAALNDGTRQQLIARVQAADSRVSNLEAQVTQSQQDLQAAEVAKLAGTSLGTQAQAKLNRLRRAVGFSPLAGYGVQVTMQDAPADVTSGTTSAAGRVMDRDIQMVVNGLWQSGATGITVNNRRLTSTSAIRKAGEAILVDYRPLLPPYVITAVGPDGDALAGRFRDGQAGLLLEQLQARYGVVWDLQTLGATTLPAAASNTIGGN